MARTRKKAQRNFSGWLALLALALGLGAFGVLVWQNAQASAPVVAAGIPTSAPPTETVNPLLALLRDGGANATPLPTVGLPSINPTLPQLTLSEQTPTAFSAGSAGTGNLAALTLATPTLPPPTASGQAEVVAQVVTRPPTNFQPPPLIPPISRDPLGRDHYWLQRPIDSNAQNWVLGVYSYGSDGPDKNNPLRVHHGIDMPNRVGEIVRAAGAGTVIWAADGRQGETPIFENSPSYGNVILIEHDFGYQGRPIWTLYAHLSSSFVQVGQVVQMGEAIGQVGATGNVTGPHLHFEVRMGQNRYGSTYNPILWMVPYVGHGVIAGRVVDERGNNIMDADITIRNFATGAIHTTTTSYVYQNNGFDVNPDPTWNENFAVADVPIGRYNVIAVVNGERVVQQVTVLEGTTAFVELRANVPNSPTPAPTDAPTEGNGG